MPKQKFAAFDIDGTLIRWQLYHAVFDVLAAEALADSHAYQSIKEARALWKRREHPESYKQYELLVVKAYGKLLKNLSQSQYQKAINAVFEEHKDQTYTFTRDLIKKLKGDGYLLFAISGSPAEVVEKLANYYGFDDFEAAVFERRGDGFSGRELSTVHSKGELLKNLAAKHHAGFAGSLAIGDGFSDRNVLELVETPIAFNPEARLYETAKQNGWKIVIERKNVIYELEKANGGYKLT